jgi:hypothetical protein
MCSSRLRREPPKQPARGSVADASRSAGARSLVSHCSAGSCQSESIICSAPPTNRHLPRLKPQTELPANCQSARTRCQLDSTAVREWAVPRRMANAHQNGIRCPRLSPAHKPVVAPNTSACAPRRVPNKMKPQRKFPPAGPCRTAFGYPLWTPSTSYTRRQRTARRTTPVVHAHRRAQEIRPLRTSRVVNSARAKCPSPRSCEDQRSATWRAPTLNLAATDHRVGVIGWTSGTPQGSFALAGSAGRVACRYPHC